MTCTNDRSDDVAYISATLRSSQADLSPASIEDAWTRISRSTGAEWRRTDNMPLDLVHAPLLLFAASS